MNDSTYNKLNKVGNIFRIIVVITTILVVLNFFFWGNIIIIPIISIMFSVILMGISSLGIIESTRRMKKAHEDFITAMSNMPYHGED